MWPAGLRCMLLQHVRAATKFLGSIGRCYGEGKEKDAQGNQDRLSRVTENNGVACPVK